jgi:hypothetical protein
MVVVVVCVPDTTHDQQAACLWDFDADVGSTGPAASGTKPSVPPSSVVSSAAAPVPVPLEDDLVGRPVLEEGLDGADLLDPGFLTHGLGPRLASDVLQAISAALIGEPLARANIEKPAGYLRPLIQLHLTASGGLGAGPGAGSVGGAASRSPSRFSDDEGPGRRPVPAVGSAHVVFKPSAQEVVDTVLAVFDRIPSACHGHSSVTATGTSA